MCFTLEVAELMPLTLISGIGFSLCMEVVSKVPNFGVKAVSITEVCLSIVV